MTAEINATILRFNDAGLKKEEIHDALSFDDRKIIGCGCLYTHTKSTVIAYIENLIYNSISQNFSNLFDLKYTNSNFVLLTNNKELLKFREYLT